MHDVFISYSTKDMSQAETVRDVLERNGIPCWMAPRDIPGGSNYAREIPIAIRACQVFVLVMSENAQSSNWVVKELDNAVNCGKIIMPLMLEDCPLNDEFNFLLTGAQRYAAYQKSSEVLNALVERIKAVIVPRQPKAEPETASVHTDETKTEQPRKEIKREQTTPSDIKEATGKKSADAPVVVQAKPKKPRKVKEKIPFVLGKEEALAALIIPGFVLVTVMGFFWGLMDFKIFRNSFDVFWYFRNYGMETFMIRVPDVEYTVLCYYVVTAALIAVLMWLSWVRLRNRDRVNTIRSGCPSCGSERLKVYSFRTKRLTGKEKLSLLVIPVVILVVWAFQWGLISALPGNFGLHRYVLASNVWVRYEMLAVGKFQGVALALWVSGMMVRRSRMRAGLGIHACRCKDCRATFLPVANRK